MRLIGLMCKHGDMFSLQILIGRTLFLSEIILRFLSPFSFVLYPLFFIAGAYCKEVPPVPIPNTAVKLFHDENTWLVTTWEISSVPASINTERNRFFCSFSLFMGH